jgi:fructokinase
MNLWGIDLGGTKIEGVVLDPARPDVPLHRLRRPTEAIRGYDHIVAQISGVVADLEQATGLSRSAAIGIGTPGVTDRDTGHLKNSNTTCLNGRPLQSDLAAALGVRVRLANDANCCALAEAVLGAGRGFRVVMGLILGTGVGGGIVVDGRILDGPHGIAGEWGHNPICGESTPCYCGRTGCVETVIAGPALERFYRGRHGEPAALPEIVVRADGGDVDAQATIARLREKFGEAIAAVINILDPDVIVIGGGVGNIAALYDDETRAAVKRHLFNDELRTEFRRPLLGDSAGVFGAAMLCR